MPLDEQFEVEWDDLSDLLEEVGALRQRQRFSPSRARAFASELILATSVDEAKELMKRDPVGAEDFSVAAHFAVGFARGGAPVVDIRSSNENEPFLLVASSVLNLLDTLSDKFSQNNS